MAMMVSAAQLTSLRSGYGWQASRTAGSRPTAWAGQHPEPYRTSARSPNRHDSGIPPGLHSDQQSGGPAAPARLNATAPVPADRSPAMAAGLQARPSRDGNDVQGAAQPTAGHALAFRDSAAASLPPPGQVPERTILTLAALNKFLFALLPAIIAQYVIVCRNRAQGEVSTHIKPKWTCMRDDL